MKGLIARKGADNITLKLDSGAHRGEKGACAMEAVALLSGEPKVDNPECADPSLTGLLVFLNDKMNYENRQGLWEYVPRVINTRNSTVLYSKYSAVRKWVRLNGGFALRVTDGEIAKTKSKAQKYVLCMNRAMRVLKDKNITAAEKFKLLEILMPNKVDTSNFDWSALFSEIQYDKIEGDFVAI